MGGPVEQAGQVATGFVESLKQQPLILAMAFMNLALLGILFYVAHNISANHALDVETQRQLHKLLAECVIQPR